LLRAQAIADAIRAAAAEKKNRDKLNISAAAEAAAQGNAKSIPRRVR
jgi:hypothetical protein